MNPFKFEERPYQKEAVGKAVGFLAGGKESVLIESPVGSGKTVMGLMVIKALQDATPGLTVNWVASRKHILNQTYDLNEAFFHCRLNYVSVFDSNPPKADFVVLDEAHHEATQSCLDMYEHTGNRLTLGLSATPLRTDKMRLSFQSTVRCCGIQKLINMGVLSQYYSYKIPKWNVDSAAEIFCEFPEKWGKSLVFFQTIRECEDFQARLLEDDIPCEVITGKSNHDKQLEAFIGGDVQVVANVAFLCEGFDLPELQSVFLRDSSRLPTIQMAGRGLRKSPLKDHCNLVQSEGSPFPVERIASPKEAYSYMKGQWVSCTGNTQVIADTIVTSLQLIKHRNIEMPRYIIGGRHVKQLSLKHLLA